MCDMFSVHLQHLQVLGGSLHVGGFQAGYHRQGVQAGLVSLPWVQATHQALAVVRDLVQWLYLLQACLYLLLHGR